MNLLKYIRNVNEIMEDLQASNGKALEHLKELHDSLILEQATNNMDKAKKSRTKTISDLIKKCNYEKFKGIFEDGGKWCFANGFILFALNDKVEGLPEIKADFQAINIIEGAARECTFEIKVDLLKINELITLNKTNRKKDIIPYKIILDNVKICFNPEYYKTMMDMLGAGCKVYVNPTSARAPLYFTSDIGSGIMLHMICKEN